MQQAQQPTQPAQQPKEAAQNNQDNKDNSGDKQDKGFASIRLGTDANGRVAVNDAQERQISSVLRKQRIQTFDVAVTIGAVAPASVRLGAVSADIVEVLPQFRGYSFFATRENVVIVEPDSKKIVALVPVQLTATASRPQQERSATRSDTTRKSSETRREPAIETRREASTTIERDVTVGSGIPTREEILAAPVVAGNTAVTRTYRAVPNETIIIERRRRPPAWLFGFDR